MDVAPAARIMVVDDLAENTQLLTQILTANNYQVRAFLSGKLALRAVVIEPPDLLLLDINMPEMDGYELAEQVHRKPGLEKLPIIFISASNDIEVKTKAFSKGGVDYISKPFQTRELLARIEVHLRLMRQNEQLERANKELKALSQAKSHFLSTMSHEIRTPMNAILGFSELLQYSEQLDEQEREDVGTIISSGEHLLALINDVLEMSKIESGRIRHSPEAMDLRALFKEMGAMFGTQCSNKNLQLVVECDQQVDNDLLLDKGKLKQILINLLGNAVKFTRHGEIRLIANLLPPVEADGPDKAELQVTVSDTGVGIAHDEIDQVFKSFEQTQSGRDSEQGTGLGMAISRQYAQLMGGDLSVSSVLGKGTSFLLKIPCALSSGSTSLVSGSTQPRVIGLKPGQPTYRILMADDIKTNRLILWRYLSPLGLEVKEACNGLEALEIYDDWQPDLVFTDMKMPLLSGAELIAKIKTRPDGDQVPIVVLSASAFEEDRQKILAMGVREFIRKPFKEQEIMVALGKHLGLEYIYDEEAQHA